MLVPLSLGESRRKIKVSHGGLVEYGISLFKEGVLYEITVNLEGERVLFCPLSSHFLKENQFSGVSCIFLLVLFGLKGVLGC